MYIYFLRLAVKKLEIGTGAQVHIHHLGGVNYDVCMCEKFLPLHYLHTHASRNLGEKLRFRYFD